MKKIKTWYTMEKSPNGYTIWENKKGQFSYGSRGLFTGAKEECKEFIKGEKIKIVKRKQ